MTANEQISANVRQLRTDLGLTQEIVAGRLNTRQSAVAALELGHRGWTPETIAAMARALGVPVALLMKGV